MKLTIEQELSVWAKQEFMAIFDQIPADTLIDVVTATDDAFGDFQCNAPMGLARILRLSPKAIAEKFAAHANRPPIIDRIEVAGPGFINIHLANEWITNYLALIESDEKLGIPLVQPAETIIIDYSSPNIAKPMHIAHIRSIVIGNAIDRMLRELGHNVISDNHVGDWGTQFGVIIMGYRHFLDDIAFAENPVAELERIYVKSYTKAKADDSWMDQCRRELVKLQQGDKENRSLWRTIVDLSLQDLEQTYNRLDVKFDLTRGESYYHDFLNETVERLDAAGLVKVSEGAVVVDLEEEKLPVCIVKKTDGGYNYATTDIATIQHRIHEFAPKRILYVTDDRQNLHFRQLFAVARRLGITVELTHIGFGLMSYEGRPISTREGNVIKLEHMLDEAESRALNLVQQSSPEMPVEKQKQVARAVGLGAVKYADLCQNPQSAVMFTWEKALSMDGNSAPYLQYACARMASVRDKYRERFPDGKLEDHPFQISDPLERLLAVRILKFPDTLKRAANQYRPNLLADYLFDLAQLYSRFYQNVPFLKADEGIRESRVRLCGLINRTLRTGLKLLGIDTPDRI